MLNKNSHDINLVVYHEDKPAGVFKLDHIGLLGMHVKGGVSFPKNSQLEIEIMGPNKTCVDNSRVPVVVSSSNSEGTALRLKSYDDEFVQCWARVLSEVYSSFKNRKYKNAINSM